MGIKQGDFVEMILQPDSSLLLLPKRSGREAKVTPQVVVSTMESPEDAGRKLIAYYLAGYDNITIRFRGASTGVRSYLKQLIRNKLVGGEVV